MQPIPQSNSRQNERARKLLHSSTPRHLKRSRMSSQSSTGWSLYRFISFCAGKLLRTGWQTKLSILKKTHRDVTLRLCQRSQLTLTPPNWLTQPTTLSSNNRWEFAADIQTCKQYSCIGSTNAQKHLATTAISQKTPIVFLKMQTPLEAEAAIALICFSKINLETRMTPKIFNSETIFTTEPSMTKSGNKGSTVWEREISIPLVLLAFTSIPHLLHQSVIIAKSSFNNSATDALSRECGILQNRVESSA